VTEDGGQTFEIRDAIAMAASIVELSNTAVARGPKSPEGNPVNVGTPQAGIAAVRGTKWAVMPRRKTGSLSSMAAVKVARRARWRDVFLKPAMVAM